MAVKVFIDFGFNCFMKTNVWDDEGQNKRISESRFLEFGLFACFSFLSFWNVQDYGFSQNHDRKTDILQIFIPEKGNYSKRN